ncbi:MAG: lipid-A-disaccharide synthase [Oligoflexia bacterium]|nr:MAG: lipid-A-disaccharide synthase [Oligoflexia bacterium]
MHQVLIVAAEASSALYAQRLIEYWKSEKKPVKAFGVGTQEMEILGFERIGKAEEMAVFGLVEVIEKYSHLKVVFNNLVQAAKERRPDVVIIMDYPDFNLMLAKEMHALGIPVVYYITPQLWAWRKGRVKKIQKYCSEVFVLFPFEVEFFEKNGVKARFVGHPLLDEIQDKYFDPHYRKMRRQQFGIQDSDIVIGLMPGSRRSEVSQHMQIQLQVARQFLKNYKNIKILMIVAPTFTKEQIQDYMGDIQFPLIMVKDEPFEMINLADYILAASGTATLIVGLLHKPMVIMYRLKFLTGLIARIVVRGVKFFGIVNLIHGREIVPERWQGGANPQSLYELMKRYIDDPAYAEAVRNDLRQLQKSLGNKGATVRVAHAIEEGYFK